ncbi:uncharacterized protein [Nicotiana sylvestris]|uniref:uncharacterized protein n=1 Tax=Nicotiana sylvestris TaxID=4096 RepID=UPI00388CB98D
MDDPSSHFPASPSSRFCFGQTEGEKREKAEQVARREAFIDGMESKLEVVMSQKLNESEATNNRLKSEMRAEMDRFSRERRELAEQIQEVESQNEWLRSERDDKIAKLTAEKRALQDHLHDAEAQLSHLKSRKRDELKRVMKEKNTLAERSVTGFSLLVVTGYWVLLLLYATTFLLFFLFFCFQHQDRAKSEVAPGYLAWYRRELEHERPTKRPHILNFAESSQKQWDWLAKEKGYRAEISKLKRQIEGLKYEHNVQVATDLGKKNKLTQENETLNAQIQQIRIAAINQQRSRSDERLIKG